MGRSGTGLGLAIVLGTVKDHNGYIDLRTEIGQGTTFTLYFPVTREELIAQQQKAILVSGFSETDRVREAQKLGAGAYVKKPYIMEKIGLAIHDELNR